MLSNLPVVRSAPARALFLISAGVTVALLLWSHALGFRDRPAGISPIFYQLFVTQDCDAAACALFILIIAALVPQSWRVPRILAYVSANPGKLAAASLIVLAAGCLLLYHNHPLSMDEYSQFFQSQVFAAGHLTGAFPPALINWLIPERFQNYFLSVSHTTGAVASHYWPSFALLMTPFTWAGVPWACNATITVLTLLVIYRLGLQLYGERESAALAVLLSAASPVLFANGISYYSMPAHLLANAVYALLLLEPTNRRAWLAGLVGSIALTLHNPVPHMLFALPWIAWLAWRPDRLRLLGCLLAGYAPLCLVLGFGWYWFNGHLAGTMSAVQAVGGASLLIKELHLPEPDTLQARGMALAKIWLWAVPGLLVLAAAGAWKFRRHTGCKLLLASAISTFIGYLFVRLDQGHGWGFRYFHSAWLALPLLAAGALRSGPPGTAGHFESPHARTFVVACALLTLVFGVGQRAYQIRHFITEDLRQVPAYVGSEPRVIIIDPTRASYGEDLVQNDPLMRSSVIRLVSHGLEADARLMSEYFPGYRRAVADPHGEVWLRAVGHPPEGLPPPENGARAASRLLP